MVNSEQICNIVFVVVGCICTVLYRVLTRLSSKSKLRYDSQPVSQYVLVSNTLVGLATRYYFLSECCCLKFVILYLWAPSLTRGRAQLYPRALGSLYVVSYDSQGYGGGILTLPVPGVTGPCIHV
jgi:hypothetical protein